MTQAIDTTVRGVVYESCGAGAREGEARALAIAQRNAIPAVVLGAPLDEPERWQREAAAAVTGLLSSA
jgi:hypothetical protein